MSKPEFQPEAVYQLLERRPHYSYLEALDLIEYITVRMRDGKRRTRLERDLAEIDRSMRENGIHPWQRYQDNDA